MENQTLSIPHLSWQSSQSVPSLAYSDTSNPCVSGDGSCADVIPLPSLTTRQFDTEFSSDSQSNVPNPCSETSPVTAAANSPAAQVASTQGSKQFLPSLNPANTYAHIPWRVIPLRAQDECASYQSQSAWMAPRSASSPESQHSDDHTAPSSTRSISSTVIYGQEKQNALAVSPSRMRAVSEESLDAISLVSDSRANDVDEVDPVRMFHTQLRAASRQMPEKRKLFLTSGRDLPDLFSVLAERMTLIKQAIENVPEFPLSAISPVVLWKVFEFANPVAECCIPLMLRFIQDMFFAITRTYDPLEFVIGTNANNNNFSSFSLNKHLQQLFEWSDFALMEDVPRMPIAGADTPDNGDIPVGWNKGWERLCLLAARLPLVRNEWELGQVWLCNRNTMRDKLLGLNRDAVLSDTYGIRVDPVSMQLTIGWCAMSVDGAKKPALRFNDVELIPLAEGGFTTSSHVPAVHNLKLRSVQELLDLLGLRVHINDVRRE